MQKTCIFPLEVCFKENTTFFAAYSSLACGDAVCGVCVWFSSFVPLLA